MDIKKVIKEVFDKTRRSRRKWISQILQAVL